MDSLFANFSPFPILDNLPEDNFSNLRTAISQKSYPLIYKELRRCTHTFSPRAAFHLLLEAMENELTLNTFRAILERCPPVPEVLSADRTYHFALGTCGLTEEAVYLDRADVLALLLERGATPNRLSGFDFSPMEAALAGRSLKSVQLLAEQPELDTTWTTQLLCEWARPDTAGPLHEFCLQAMAPRFIGADLFSFQPLPIPEPMTLQIIAQSRNWPLLERFCRERGPISQKDGHSVVQMFSVAALDREENDRPACAAALAALLESCPNLLRKETACRALLRCFLNFDEDARAGLRPWVERLGRRRIAMERPDWFCEEYSGLLDRWQKLLPQGPILVIDRWSDVFDTPYAEDGPFGDSLFGTLLLTPKNLRRILTACPIRGKRRKGKLSPVAQAALSYGDVPLIESLFLPPNELLAEEDPDALLEYVQGADCPRGNRGAVLVHIRKEEDYAL